MNHNCQGTTFQLIEEGNVYYRCLLDGSFWNHPATATCPNCGRPIDAAAKLGVMQLKQSRSVLQIKLAGQWVNLEVKNER